MCLTRILDMPLPESGFGFKVIQYHTGLGILDTFFSNVLHTIFLPNEWITDAYNKYLYQENEPHNTYKSGFHIFDEKRYADEFRDAYFSNGFGSELKVFKVEYKDVVCVGLQNNAIVIVAKRIKVCV